MTAPARTAPAPEPARDSARAGNDAGTRADPAALDTAPATQLTPALYKIREAVVILRLSRSEIYAQLRKGRLRSVHQGRARLIPSTAIDDYIKLLEREEAEGNEVA